MSIARSHRLETLKAEVRAIEARGREGGHRVVPFGLAEIDARLADGGIVGGALHEATGAAIDLADETAAALFLAGIAARFPGTVLWVLARRDLFAPGLQQGGLGPDRVLFAEARAEADILPVMEEGLRHGGLAAVIGEATKVPMAASRRLQLAAETHGVPALLLRRRGRAGECAFAEPSAAATRWTLAPAPSAPLVVPGIGRARWRLALVRQRGGEPFDLTVEANDAEGRLALPARLRDRAAAPPRPKPAGRRAAA